MALVAPCTLTGTTLYPGHNSNLRASPMYMVGKGGSVPFKVLQVLNLHLLPREIIIIPLCINGLNQKPEHNSLQFILTQIFS